MTLPETEKLIMISNMFGVSLDYLLKDQPREKTHDRTGESLDRVILRFLGSAQDIEEISKTLIDVMQDGIIDEEERIKLDAIIVTLDEIAKNIEDIKIKMAKTKE